MNNTASSYVEPVVLGQYLTFVLGKQRYAMPTAQIREVVGFSSLTEVPMTPDFLRGVVNVRGAVIPLVDLSLRLGLAATVFGKRTCVVILELAHETGTIPVGVLVDVVHAVFNVDAQQIEPVPEDPPVRPDFIGEVLRLEGDPVISLDITRVLALDELVDLMGGLGFGAAVSVAARQGPAA